MQSSKMLDTARHLVLLGLLSITLLNGNTNVLQNSFLLVHLTASRAALQEARVVLALLEVGAGALLQVSR